MISKYNFFKNQVNYNIDNNRDVIINRFMTYLTRLKFKYIRVVNIGTLGIVFLAYINDKRVYIKTCFQFEENINNLKKEFLILSNIYKNQLIIYEDILKYNNINYYYIVIESLENVLDLNLNDILKIENDIYNYGISTKIINYNLYDFLLNIINDINILEKLGCTIKTIDMVFSSIIFLKNNYPKNICVNHGDLCLNNIKFNKNSNILLIDWEDSLIGFKGYDTIYFLSFLSSKKYYSNSEFPLIYDLEFNLAKSAIVFIVAAKCILSYYQKSYLTNKITADDRLNDILFTINKYSTGGENIHYIFINIVCSYIFEY